MTQDSKPMKKIWVDGCFDMMHYGHANALRQARELGDYLVVGVHSDAEIMKHKGIPVMKEEERYAAVAACKWVDEVVPDAPYVTELEVMDKYGCQVCVHGDDLSTAADGSDSYAKVKAAGRFLEVKRTIGVSTTELVGRMLLMTRDHHDEAVLESKRSKTDLTEPVEEETKASPYTSGGSHLMPTNRRIVQFSTPAREPKPGDRIVYVDGAFDLFHVGHAELLKKAKALGDFLLVGIHDDPTINKIKGSNYPLMSLQERVLSVLSCRHVDEVIIGAPYSVTKDVLEKYYKVDIVAHGKTEAIPDANGEDPYKVPKEMGIYREVDSEHPELTCDNIIDRILANRRSYEERNRKKEAKELAALNASKSMQ